MPGAALVIMARYPIAGEVKTRLARAIGAEAACGLYRAFLRDLDARFAGGARTLVWAYHPPEQNFAALLAAGARCLAQRGEDLGARMYDCFRTLFSEGFAPVIMIGADVPHVREAWLDEAQAALADNDLVLGPSIDGGYYLIAMRAPHDVFDGIVMGTPRVLTDTLRRAHAAGLRVHRLPPTFDVDTAADLQQLRTLLHAAEYREQLPHTAAVLDRLP